MKKPFYDLLICMRTHNYFNYVCDTAESVNMNIIPETTKLVFSVNKVSHPFIDGMIRRFKNDVYVSQRKWSLGIGLFGLLIASINHFEKLYDFNHFLSIDYDTLFLGPGADQKILDRITSPNIGCLGVYRPGNRWNGSLRMAKSSVERAIKHRINMTTNESIQGGFMTLTRSYLETLRKHGIMKDYPAVVSSNHMADDYFVPLLARVFGMDVVECKDFAYCTWKMAKDPRGLERQGYLVTHPTKGGINGQRIEGEVRDYFKKLRHKIIKTVKTEKNS